MGKEQRHEWTVSGMDCAACSLKVTRAVERLPGVSDVQVALMSERLSVALAPGSDAAPRIEAAVRRLGYGIAPRAAGDRHAAPHDHGHHDHAGHDHAHSHEAPGADGHRWYQTAKGRLVLLSGLLLVLAYGVGLIGSPAQGQWAFRLACLIGLAPVARRALAALRMGQPFTIEGLMTIAALGAIAINAAEEAALVVFLFAVGEVLEGVAASTARDGIRALGALVPTTALIETADGTQSVPAASLRIGQTVMVRPGDRVPADGQIIDGISSLDESPITGESVPVTKGPGESVFAGAINAEATLRLSVTRAAADNTISRIIRLVEEAEEARAPTERFIDRFSRWYMPCIVGLAALVILLPPVVFGQDWNSWIYRGLALLLIGCPCALVISVPASIASALSAGARRGLLMKGGAVIEAMATIRQIAFDKTGTLTHGKPVVTDLEPAPGVTADQLLRLAAAVEGGSNHPLARAILTHARDLPPGAAPLVRGARALPGKGMQAEVDGVPSWVASPPQAEAAGVMTPDALARATELEEHGKTVVAPYQAGRLLGLIALRDEPRADAAEAMRQLRDLGLSATMLTGDNPRTAAAIAGGLGIGYRAQMLPEDKLAAIRSMESGGPVMMIGDGINDAPALKQAQVGVAMGSGTDVALETADAAMLRDRLTDAPALIRLARATMGNIRQNIGLALGLKAVFLVTSMLGMTGLWIAILADTGATVLVTLNALRLLRFDPSRA